MTKRSRENRTRRIQYRATPAEEAIIKAGAAAMGMTTSKYCRWAAMQAAENLTADVDQGSTATPHQPPSPSTE